MVVYASITIDNFVNLSKLQVKWHEFGDLTLSICDPLCQSASFLGCLDIILYIILRYILRIIARSYPHGFGLLFLSFWGVVLCVFVVLVRFVVLVPCVAFFGVL